MIIIYSLIGVVLLGVIVSILRSVDWYSVFAGRYGNNPLKAKVYVKTANGELFYDGWYVGNDDKFFYYDYLIDKYRHTAIVPILWDTLYVRGRRKICVDFGNEFAKPLVAGDVYQAMMGSETFSKAIDKRLALEMVKSVKSRKGISIGLWLVVIAVIGVGLFIWKPWQSKTVPEYPVTQNQTQIQTTPTPTIDYDNLTDQQLKDLLEGK